MRARFCVLLLAGLLGLAFFGCAKPVPVELERGVAAVRKMMAPMYMKKSMFYVAYPNGKPSDYVSYLFSDVGAAERPPLEGSGEFPEDEGMGRSSLPVWPKDVLLLPNQPQPQYTGSQLVISADDTKGAIIVKGYAPMPEASAGSAPPEPVLVEEITLVKVAPDPLAQSAFQSSVEMGASPAMRGSD